MKLIWQDAVFVIGMLLYLGIGVSTNFIISSVEAYTDVAVELESNPLVRSIIDTKYYFKMMQWSAIAFFSGVYIMMRRKLMKGVLGTGDQMLTFYTIALFVLFLQNFLNDFPIALKMFLGG